MDGLAEEGVGVQPAVEDDATDDRGGEPPEELLGRLDWARQTNDDESVQSILELIMFPNFSEPNRGPKKRRPTKPWHSLWDAIAEVSGADSRESTRAHVAKVARDLYNCDLPYTPEEVRKLPAVLAEQPWWQTGMKVSIQVIQKHIGLVRDAAAIPTVEPTDECVDLAELRKRAIRSRLGGSQ